MRQIDGDRAGATADVCQRNSGEILTLDWIGCSCAGLGVCEPCQKRASRAISSCECDCHDNPTRGRWCGCADA